jgi:eukaryotic-like serine/threonine-protein kinase
MGSASAVVFDAILHEAPTSPVRPDPELPPNFERLVNKALEKDRDLRYQSAAELRADLKRLKRDTDSGQVAAAASAASGSTAVCLATPVSLLSSGSVSLKLGEASRKPSRKIYLMAAAVELVLVAAGVP